MRASVEDRLVLVLLGFLFLLFCIAVRCFWLQVAGAERYREYAMSQLNVSQTIQAMRGSILDRNGKVMAQTVIAPSVFANSRRVEAKQEMAKHLSELVGRPEGFVKQRLERDKNFVWVARQVDLDLLPELNRLRTLGVGVLEESKRIYPHGNLAAHVLGFVNIDHRGLEGIELAYDRILRGQNGWRSTLRDARGRRLIGERTEEVDPIHGHDIRLTLDSVIQEVAEETLKWGIERFNAKGGSITILDPNTGAVLAMANWPTYDLNNPGGASEEKRRNRAVTDLFEPGSTFKILTAAALLEERLIDPEEPIFCENGQFPTVGSHVLRDHSPYGTLPFKDVVRVSSNIGIAKAAQRLSPEKFHFYIRAFGFGERTGIELPGEIRGQIASPERWSRLSPYILAIGHEIAVTPLQLAGMVAIVANGGLRVKPHLIDRITNPQGEIVYAFEPPGEKDRLIGRETAEILHEMLSEVVASGTGRRAKVKGLTVAGKTGTAQKIEPNGRYSHSRFVASFAGYVPVPEAKLVIVVNMDEPRPVYYGGSVAAPMFRRIVERLSSYLDLPKDQLTRNGQTITNHAKKQAPFFELSMLN